MLISPVVCRLLLTRCCLIDYGFACCLHFHYAAAMPMSPPRSLRPEGSFFRCSRRLTYARRRSPIDQCRLPFCRLSYSARMLVTLLATACHSSLFTPCSVVARLPGYSVTPLFRLVISLCSLAYFIFARTFIGIDAICLLIDIRH